VGAAVADILLAYGTTEGHTRTIAERIAGLIAEAGHRVHLVDTAAASALPERLDAVILGASVHQGHHQSSVSAFVRAHKGRFEHIPAAFFSVSLAAALHDELGSEEAQGYIDDFVAETGWHPRWTVAFAGALRHDRYDYLRDLLLRLLAQRLGHGVVRSEDVVYTDWADVDAFTLHFLHDAFETVLSEKSRRGS
jgi:menaquinone-dependent protoporphyrinogen oxidase